ncbi:MAG: aspartate carbamoyltransferase regulatory subunit [Clostridia bacterium]|nr:aspartate carbamoyltransferase regulatory subunit [Clostridia bacterium]
MTVDSIKNGFVIDHIKPGNGMKIYKLLGLESLNCPIALIQNAVSDSMGAKDIIKIDADVALDTAILGYVDPDVTVNVIKDSKIVDKYHPGLPRELVNIVKCKNPRCITTTEQELDHVFRLTDESKRVYRCIYCETASRK